jgi:hypothetical protein
MNIYQDAFLSGVLFPILGLIPPVLSWVAQKWLAFVTDSKAGRNWAHVFVFEKLMGCKYRGRPSCLAEYYVNDSGDCYDTVSYYFFLLVLSPVLALIFPILVCQPMIAPLTLLFIGGTYMARFLTRTGKKAARIKEALEEHVNNKEIHKG